MKLQHQHAGVVGQALAGSDSLSDRYMTAHFAILGYGEGDAGRTVVVDVSLPRFDAARLEQATVSPSLSKKVGGYYRSCMSSSAYLQSQSAA